MPSKRHTSLTSLQLAMLVLATVIVCFVWILFLWQNSALRTEALNAHRSENQNLALIVSESLKQMTDRGNIMGSLLGSTMTSSREGQADFLTLLAKDPVFNRFSIYSPSGELIYTSHRGSARPHLQDWMDDIEAHFSRVGFVPLLPNRRLDPAYTPEEPSWRLPFLVPVDASESSGSSELALVELDTGYLASLMQNVQLGSGFIQILDSTGEEWMRANESGIVVGGTPVPGIAPAREGRVVSEETTIDLPEGRYQYVFVTRPRNGFTVAVAQPYEEIFSSLALGRAKQIVANILVTVLVMGIAVWLIKGLTKQQRVLEALRRSEHSNQLLIKRLETENARSNRAASIDHLSGLFNRRQFMDEANALIQEQRRKRRLSSILFIDLDRFKSINDSLGHHTGDLLLQAVAGRIQSLLSKEDIAARFGGDEFVVLLAGNRTEATIVEWATALTTHLSAPYMLEDTELNTSPSIGIAISPRDGQSIEQLTRCADAAMYSAKKAGRGQYRFFDPSLNDTNIDESFLEHAFDEALANRNFLLHYQPQVRLENMEVVRYEALVRWQHPDLGLLYPGRFIPVAEKTGFLVKLGLEVLRLACAQISEWQAIHGTTKPIAINVCAVQLCEPDFDSDVLKLIEDNDLTPDLLEFEVTETAVLQRCAVECLQRLRQAGIRISLDDFGTGESRLSDSDMAPFEKLKIDRSLIDRISNNHEDSPIVSSTIILAKRLRLTVVAEGVETHEQLVYLKVAGCNLAQGYYLGRPLPADKIPELGKVFPEQENAG